ncbi:unnamed protein product [Caenorhabditis angaria]|uniref:F-box domain-containing protein n=1 Tax=Caenorhabditis angaria TaxID=860376 RepID=A0A9P1IJL7_9PELO|nr:unnamed protein product [Caenorhabditis angaria]
MEPVQKKQKICTEDASKLPEEKQTGWDDLPYELRRIIVEEMEFETIFKFAQCSNLCYSDAIQSPKYMHGIEIITEKRKLVTFEISHAKDGRECSITFKTSGTNTIVSYYRRGFKDQMLLKWQETKKGQKSKIAGKFLFDYLNKFEKNLKVFKAKGDEFIFENLTLSRAIRLETFEFLVEAHQNIIKNRFITLDLLCRIRNSVKLHLPLTFKQAIQLKCKKLCLKPMCFSFEDLNKFFQLWSNGEVHENFAKMQLVRNPEVPYDFEKLLIDVNAIDFQEKRLKYYTFKLVNSNDQNKYLKVRLLYASVLMKVFDKTSDSDDQPSREWWEDEYFDESDIEFEGF